MWRLFKHLFLLCTALFLAAVIGGVIWWQSFKNWGTTQVQLVSLTSEQLSSQKPSFQERVSVTGVEWSDPSPPTVTLQPGMRLEALALALYDAGAITSSRYFELWVRIFSDYSRFKAGSYRFEGAISPVDLIEALVQGKVYQPTVFKITIPEGFTIKRLAERLASARFPNWEAISQQALDPQFAASLKVPAKTLEGYLSPATYEFTDVPSPTQLLTRMVDHFWNRLPSNYVDRLKERDLSLAEAVIFASLIELESAAPDERRMISEVIWNRINRRMTLGIDAAVIYGIKDYQGDITFAHLRDASNPYNLRIHGGLPPTAIGSPSLDSLLAVLDPTDEGWLYYVTEPGGTRRHIFTRTLADHNREVRKLVRSKGR